MTKLRRHSFAIRHSLEVEPVPIVSDALMATQGLADGRLIPVVILGALQESEWVTAFG
jgi:hypothetical protein